MLDDELCGAALRMARGIEVNDETLALDLIKEIGFSGNYLTQGTRWATFARSTLSPACCHASHTTPG